MTDPAGSSKRPGRAADEGLTDPERRMLDALALPGAPPARDPAASPAPRTHGAAADASPEEELVLRRAREESRRLTQTELVRMFRQPPSAAEPTAGFEALLASQPPEEAPDLSAFERSRLGRALAAVLDFVNAPFRWLPPAYRLGLGLCGVLLLITLILVVIVKMVRT